MIVINAEKVALTGKKEDQKVYRHFTGYPGGLVELASERLDMMRLRLAEQSVAQRLH